MQAGACSWSDLNLCVDIVDHCDCHRSIQFNKEANNSQDHNNLDAHLCVDCHLVHRHSACLAPLCNSQGSPTLCWYVVHYCYLVNYNCILQSFYSHIIFCLGIEAIDPIEFCIEMWPIAHGRVYYSVGSMIIQYVLPFALLYFLNTRLTHTIKTRNVKRTANIQTAEIKALSAKKTRTNTRLLKSIIYIFLISWFPINLVNLVTDLFDPFRSDESFRITFAVCHIIGKQDYCDGIWWDLPKKEKAWVSNELPWLHSEWPR